MEEGENDNDIISQEYPATTSVFEATLACIQALSRTRIEEEVRLQLLGKIFEGLSSFHLDRKRKCLPEIEEDIRDKVSDLGCSSPKLSFQGKPRAPEKGEVHDKTLLAFLHKAMAQGALVLKDMDSVIQCYHETKLENELVKESIQNEVYLEHEVQNAGEICIEEEDGKMEGKRSPNEKEMSHGPKDIVQEIISQAPVSKASTVPRNKILSSTSGCLGCLGSKDNPSSKTNVTEPRGKDRLVVIHAPTASSHEKENSFSGYHGHRCDKASHATQKELPPCFLAAPTATSHEKEYSFSGYHGNRCDKASHATQKELSPCPFAEIHSNTLHPSETVNNAASRVELVEPANNYNGGYYPADGSFSAVNKGTSVPRLEKGVNFFEKLIAKWLKETSHGDQETHAGYVTHIPNNRETHMEKGIENVEPLDNRHSLCSALHVTRHQGQSSSFLAHEKDKGAAHTPLVMTDVTLHNFQADNSILGFGPKEIVHATGNEIASNPMHPKASFSAEVKKDETKQEALHATLVKPSLSYSRAVQNFSQNCSSLQAISAEGRKDQKVLTNTLYDGSPLFKVEDDVLQKRLELCKFSVIGKISLAKGEEPWLLKKLKERLEGIWNFKSSWRLISLGKGFFHVILNSQNELDKVWAQGPLQLKPGVLRFQRWRFDFDPSKEKTTNAQVWFRIFHLPWCLWDTTIINGIARKIGVPLRFDRATLEGDFGHFARVLVDVDLSRQLKSTVLIECGNKMIEVKLMPENLPAFCRGCNSVGHTETICKTLVKKNENELVVKRNLGGEQKLKNAALVDITNAPSSLHASTSSFKKDVPMPHSKLPRFIGNSKGRSLNSKGDVKDKGIIETVTDFCAQVGAQTTKDAREDCIIVSNQFSVLGVDDDVEDVVLCNSPTKDNKGEKQNMVDNSNLISQDDSTTQPGDDEEIIFPKIPNKWSDILDEEESEDVPMFLDMEFPVKEVPKPYHPYHDHFQKDKAPRRDISEIRKGLEEMSQKYAHMLHTPISNKKDKKLKLGFRQQKEPICTSKR